MISQKIRFWLALALFVISVTLLVVSLYPIQRVQQSLPMPQVILPSSQEAGPSQVDNPPELLERRVIQLDWPERIREYDSDLIVLSLIRDGQKNLTPTEELPGGVPDGTTGPSGTPIEIPNIYDTHNIVAIARLDLAGVEAYREEIQEPMRPGRDVTFRWSIQANEPGNYRGVIWLHLDLVPKAGGTAERMLLLARTIEIEAVTVFEMPVTTARLIGVAGLVLSTLLGFPFIQRYLEYGWKRLKGRAKSSRTKSPPDSSSSDLQPEKPQNR